MCYHCSRAISTGTRHIIEYCPPSYLTDDVPEDDHERQHKEFYGEERQRLAKKWENIETDIGGISARRMPLRSIGFLDFLGEEKTLSYYQKVIMKHNPIPKEGLAEKEKLLAECGKRKISIMALASIRNPFDAKVPFFRQIYLSRGCLYWANSMNDYYSGTVELSGTPEKLAGLVRRIYEKGKQENPDWVMNAGEFVRGSPHTFSEQADFRRLLSSHGVIKFGHGHYFVVAKPDEKKEEFSFGSEPEMLESAVRSTLQGKEAGA